MCGNIALLAFVTFGYLSMAQQNDLVQIFTVDTLVVVDDVMYNSWRSRLQPNITDIGEIAQRINQYVSLVVHQANKRLATSTYHAPFQLELQVIDIQLDQSILTFLPASPLTRRINGDQALETFQKWVVNQTLAQAYDHVMLLTGKLMSSSYEGSGQGEVAGRAFVGTVCARDGTSVSVVQDSGGFQSVYYVAHEAAHNLGALHDGEAGATACPDSGLYLMSTDSGSDVGRTNPWYFSQCSVKSISDVIQQVVASDNNCLSDNMQPSTDFLANRDAHPGQIYDATQQCQMLYGSRSGLCLGDDFSLLEDICTSMYCARTTSSCVRHVAAERTSCGHKKWCQMGKCVESDTAPELGECPFGDTLLVLGDGRLTCADYVSRYPSSCYRNDIRESCCASCQKQHSGSAVCPYGDKKGGCTSDVCDQISPDGTLLADHCCATCDYTVRRECEDVSSIDGFSCPERVNAYGQQSCYNATVAFYCCQSCAELRRNVTDCEYGDIITGSYCTFNARSDNSGCVGSLPRICCRTCSEGSRSSGDLDTGSASHPNTLFTYTLAMIVFLFTISI